MKKIKVSICTLAIACSMILQPFASGCQVQAAEAESVLQVKAKAVKDPVKSKPWTGDYVYYSDCYVYQETWETVQPPVLPGPVLYQVTDAYRYERSLRKRIMELTCPANQAKVQISLNDIAFMSAAVGGKASDFKNGHGLTPVAENVVNEWKFTIKNPYDEKTNPHGVREPEISNVRVQGDCICFDYENLYSTGNSYLSAVVMNSSRTEVIAYDRLVPAAERGNGTIAIHWPREYDKESYVLLVFAEKYNGDYMTDYISDMTFVHHGVDTKWDED